MKFKPLTGAKLVRHITAEVGGQFRCFGNGRVTPGNPISAALADGPLLFAAGVDVHDVVKLVLKLNKQNESARRHFADAVRKT